MRCISSILLVVLSVVVHGRLCAQEVATSGRTVDSNSVIHLDQNWKSGWDDRGKNWYHHASQGAFMIPYEVFMALEKPTEYESGLFSDMANLERFGFLRSEQNKVYNPGNLPIGFAISENWVDPNHPDVAPVKALGLTCAACHTGEVRFQGKRIRIEGGSAMINLSAFQKELATSIFITNSMTEKFDRLANRILAPKELPPAFAAKKKQELKAGLEAAVARGLKQKELEAQMGVAGIESGYSRTDALARIGNSVFGKLDPINLESVGAPVNFPHIWDTPWFDWVQYNGSIRLPMVRNIGEALGLGAAVKISTAGTADPANYESTVNIENLHKMEQYLAGDKPWSGLRAPAWPEDDLGEIKGFRTQDGLWAKGRELYHTYCAKCHFLTSEYQAHFSDMTPNEYWSEPNKWQLKFMKTPAVNVVDIGTDPTTALDFYRRIVYTGASGKDDRQIVPAVEGLTFATVEVRNKAYAAMKLSPEQQNNFDGYREMPDVNGIPGALAPLEYKARSLDGIWATAPFLHNGSVPNLYELLLPAVERSASFHLGSTEFDPVKVGFDTKWSEGRFRMNTSIPGNRNSGHEFRELTEEDVLNDLGRKLPIAFLLSSDKSLSNADRKKLEESINDTNQKPAVHGRVGPLLKDDERYAIIEYVKSLGSQMPMPIKPIAPVVFEDKPAGEDDAIQKLGATLGMFQKMAYSMQVAKVGGQPVVATRGQHGKNHGAVRATFRVEPDSNLPENARVGLFREAKAYSAWIRFSNGKSFDDSESDVHGMAIKVLMPETTDDAKTVSQDFVTADHPVFFAKNVQHLTTFVEATGEWEVAQIKHADNKDLRDQAYQKFIAVASRYPFLTNFKSYPKSSPLEASYWSQTPYRLGPMHAVKYSVTPSSSNVYAPGADRSAKDFLKQAMVEQLTNQMIPVSFDFWVQLFQDQRTTPIEDATVPWKTDRIKVATITIYPQKFDSEADMDFCEQLSFSPWQGLPEHEPLGGINRARRPAYADSSKWRHEMNKTEQKKPGPDSF